MKKSTKMNQEQGSHDLSSDDEAFDDLAILEAANHFGLQGNNNNTKDSTRRRHQRRCGSGGDIQRVDINNVKYGDDNDGSEGDYCCSQSNNNTSMPMHHRSSHRPSTGSVASTASNKTIIRRNGDYARSSNDSNRFYNGNHNGNHDVVSSFDRHSFKENNMYKENGFDMNCRPELSEGPQQYGLPSFNKTAHSVTKRYDDDEDDDDEQDDHEIAKFTEMLPYEYENQRISQVHNRTQGRSSLPDLKRLPVDHNHIYDKYRGSTLSIDSSMMPGTMSGVISRKRRSHTELADAAAEVAAMYRDLSDSEDNFSSNDDSSKKSNHTFGTLNTQSSTTRRSSGASTSGFARLSLYNTHFDEPPRKRRSSSSSISVVDDSTRFSQRGSMIAYNAASAAIAADEASQRLSEVMHPTTCEDNESEKISTQNPQRRRFQRRAAFVVSSIETEAAAALASRTELLMKDRYEARRARLPNGPRRSMSYSSGIKMSSSIIASSMPEDAESIMENPEFATDFMKLTRSKMERRLLSLPDQNALNRLSQTSINEDVDFSANFDHKSSALSVNLEASAAALRHSYNDRLGYITQPKLDHNMNHISHGSRNDGFSNHFNFSYPQSQQNFRHEHSMTMNDFNAQQHHPSSGSLSNQSFAQDDVSTSLKVAAEVFNTNAIAAQSLAQTAQVAIAMLQQVQQNNVTSNDRRNDDNANEESDIDYESFDGKINHVDAVEPDTPEEVRASELIHDATLRDDVNAVREIINGCEAASRMLSNEVQEGNVPLHIGIKNGSDKVVKLLLDKDPKCGLIRNEYGHTPLHVAADEGNLAAVIMLCSRSQRSCKVQCEEGFLPLHNAVSTGARHADSPQITANLMQTFDGANHISTDEGLLPIHLASMSGFVAGIRTLLSYSFEVISIRESTEMMLPLDFAVDGLNDEKNRKDSNLSSNQQVDQNVGLNHEWINKNYEAAIELLLSSMLYNRLISSPRNTNAQYPFLPIHAASVACPNHESWKTIMSLYGEQHSLDVDSNGRTATHIFCSQEIEDIPEHLEVLNMFKPETFYIVDNNGFLPIHRAVTKKKVSQNFIEAILKKNHDAIAQKVQSNEPSQFENFLPVHLAAAHDCKLDIIFEMFKSTIGVSMY